MPADRKWLAHHIVSTAVVEALESTNESVISHRQNDVLRVLTVFSVVLLPLTLITGFFGMNVHFPGYGSAWAFWVIFAGMVATLARLVEPAPDTRNAPSGSTRRCPR